MSACVELTPEERADLLRVRLGRRVRCGLQWVLSKPGERTGCYWLWKCGGTFSFHRFPIPFVTPVNIVYIRKPTYSDFEMRYLSGFCNLVAVDVGDTRITERGVEHLVKSSESIRYLFLWGTEVGDSVVEPLSKLKSLEMLNISARNISYNGFLAIKHVLPNCYLSHDSFGTHFRHDSGDAATRAWIQNGEQHRAPKHPVKRF